MTNDVQKRNSMCKRKNHIVENERKPMKKRVRLDPKTLNGKQTYKLITDVVAARSEEFGGTFTKMDFCRAAGISRAQLHRLRNGEKAGADSIMKIAAGLKSWGYNVTIVV